MNIGDKFFGLSSREFALREEVCVEGIQDIISGSTRQGMRNYAPRLRQWSTQRLVVSDEQAIPKSLKLTDTFAVWLGTSRIVPISA